MKKAGACWASPPSERGTEESAIRWKVKQHSSCLLCRCSRWPAHHVIWNLCCRGCSPSLFKIVCNQATSGGVIFSNLYKDNSKNLCVFKIFYLFIERGEWREKEGEWNIDVWLCPEHPLLGTWPTTQTYALTGNLTCDVLVLRPMLNPLSYTSQGKVVLFYYRHCATLYSQTTDSSMGINLLIFPHKSLFLPIKSLVK